MKYIDDYITYISSIRRYSGRTCSIYRESLEMFSSFLRGDDTACTAASDGGISDELIPESLTPSIIRSYEVFLLESRGMHPRTVNLHLSVLIGFQGPEPRDGCLISTGKRQWTGI